MHSCAAFCWWQHTFWKAQSSHWKQWVLVWSYAMTCIQSSQSLQISVIVICCDLISRLYPIQHCAFSSTEHRGRHWDCGSGFAAVLLYNYVHLYLDALTLLIGTQYYVVAWAIWILVCHCHTRLGPACCVCVLVCGVVVCGVCVCVCVRVHVHARTSVNVSSGQWLMLSLPSSFACPSTEHLHISQVCSYVVHREQRVRHAS